jgi:RNA recognition motif-containing protein
MKLFIGSLSYNVTEGDLRRALEAFGQVTSEHVNENETPEHRN